MLRVFDSFGTPHVFHRPPRTVVSLVPSDTYSVVALGAADRLVGRTRYCIEPALQLDRVPPLGGTKNPDVDVIVDLRPDLILANREENTKRDVLRLSRAGIAVFVSFPTRVAEGLAHCATLARILGVEQDTKTREFLRNGYAELRQAEAWRAHTIPVSAFIPIWMDPLMTVNRSTFISDALDLAGAANVFADRERRYPLAADRGLAAPLSAVEIAGRDTRYPRVTWQEVIERAPELVVLPDEPHPFSQDDEDRFRALPIPAAERGTVYRCPGKDFSWYGARAIEGLARTRDLIRAAIGSR
jgi:ABC-type Fe3+-hydroxamate transport system substrate-binding protein